MWAPTSPLFHCPESRSSCASWFLPWDNHSLCFTSTSDDSSSNNGNQQSRFQRHPLELLGQIHICSTLEWLARSHTTRNGINATVSTFASDPKKRS